MLSDIMRARKKEPFTETEIMISDICVFCEINKLKVLVFPQKQQTQRVLREKTRLLCMEPFMCMQERAFNGI